METILIKIRETNKEILKEIRSLKKILIKGFKLDVDSKEEKRKQILTHNKNHNCIGRKRVRKREKITYLL